MGTSKTNIPLRDRTRLPWRVLAISLLIVSGFIFANNLVKIIDFKDKFIEVPEDESIFTLVLLKNNHLINNILEETANKEGLPVSTDISKKNKILYINNQGELIGYKNNSGNTVNLRDFAIKTKKIRLPLIKSGSAYLISEETIYKVKASGEQISIKLKTPLDIEKKELNNADISVNNKLNFNAKSPISSIKSLLINNENDYIRFSGTLEDEANPIISTIISSIPSNLDISTKNGYQEIISQDSFTTKSADNYTSFRKGTSSLTASNNNFTLSTKDIIDHDQVLTDPSSYLKGKSSAIKINDGIIQALSLKRHSFIERLLYKADFITFDRHNINICLSVDNLWKTP